VRVVAAGMNIISSLWLDLDAIWNNLIAGKSFNGHLLNLSQLVL
jgi:3-oxoacyl-(acyl-carrier-protein) synthase